MNKKYFKAIDMFLCLIWCVFFTIRLHYPKAYRPLDIVGILTVILVFVDNIILHKLNIYKSLKEDTLIQIIRIALVTFPIIYGLTICF